MSTKLNLLSTCLCKMPFLVTLTIFLEVLAFVVLFLFAIDNHPRNLLHPVLSSRKDSVKGFS